MVGEKARALPALRKAAYASVSVAALLLGYSAAAFADGGAGGLGDAGQNGLGGVSNATGTGGTGGTGAIISGGGGGGAGASGGDGGQSSSTHGGAGAETPGGDGSPGGVASPGGGPGGGGGGGAHGAVTSGAINSEELVGGKGGAGGAAYSLAGVLGGGGGGAGGYGVIATGTNGYSNQGIIAGGAGGSGGAGGPAGGSGGGGGDGGIGLWATGGVGSGLMVNQLSITGGNGGSGGGSQGRGGNGGAGGAGFSSTHASLVNNGSIVGGNGGQGGISGLIGGAAGAGGVGITGSDLSISNSGTIKGGLSGDNVRANAITFTGGQNSLTLFSTSNITGNVVAFSGADRLNLSGTTAGTFSLDLLGTQYQNFGNLGKLGTSTWTITGEQNTGASWVISGGTLKLDNANTSAATSMTVGDGGTLTGIGAIGTTTFNSGGTFAPGVAPGTSTTVNGNLTMRTNSTYQVIVSPTDTTFAVVNGTATLLGAAKALFTPGTYMQSSYKILEANLVNGGFSSLTTTNLPSGFTASLELVDGKKVMLDLTAVLGAPQSLPGSNLNTNQSSVAGGLNNYFNHGGTLPPNFTSLYGLTGSALSSALSQLSGESTHGSRIAGTQLSSRFLGAVLDPTANGRSFGGAPTGGRGGGFAANRTGGDLAAIQTMSDAGDDCDFVLDQPRWSIWTGGFGGGGVNNGNASTGTSSVVANTYGFVVGFDYNYSPDTVFGVAVSTGGSNWWLGNGSGQGRSTTMQAAAYALMRDGPAYLSVGASFADHQMTTNRSAVGDNLTATFDGQSYTARAEAGYRLEVAPKTGIAPYAAGQFQLFHTPGYSETDMSGMGFGLSYAASDSTYTRTEIGARFDTTTEFDGKPLVLRGRLGWAHDFINTPGINASFSALPGSSFIVTGTTPPPDSGLASVSVEYTIRPRLTLGTKFDGEFSGQAQSYAGMATLRYDL